jgi:hypothetical protein
MHPKLYTKKLPKQYSVNNILYTLGQKLIQIQIVVHPK